MRIVLTGGAGYVGSACLRYLLREGHDAVAYDDLSLGNRAAVPADRLVVGDIHDDASLASVLREHGADAVMHFAALASVPESVSEPNRYWQHNVGGTCSVLRAMQTAGTTRLVFSSTAATYAFDADMPITESSPQIPESPYGTTKLACERMIRDHAASAGIGAAALRYFNAAGADADGMHGESRGHETHLIPLVLSAAHPGGPDLKICGTDWPTPDGTCVRDYVHVEDLARAHEAVLPVLEPGTFRAYNIGTGRGTSVLEVIQACRRVSGVEIPWNEAPRRQGDPPTLVASSDALRRDLAWEPAYPDIESIVKTAWAWHESHPKGYASAGVTND